MAGASAPRTHFIIRAAGEERLIFSAWEARSGDVYTTTKAGRKYRSPGTLPTGDPEILDVHFSIHRSLDSPTGNLITSRIERSDNTIERAHHFTNAIKSGQSFSYLMGRRCPNLNSSTFAFTRNAGVYCSFGDYDPGNFSFLFGVFVGAGGKRFELQSDRFNVIQKTFGSVELVVAWTYLNIFSTPSGFITRISTYNPKRPDDMPEGITVKQAEQLIAGYSSQRCVTFFDKDCASMRDEYVRTFWRDIAEDDLEHVKKSCAFLKSGWRTSPEYQEYLADLKYSRTQNREFGEYSEVFPFRRIR